MRDDIDYCCAPFPVWNDHIYGWMYVYMYIARGVRAVISWNKVSLKNPLVLHDGPWISALFHPLWCYKYPFCCSWETKTMSISWDGRLKLWVFWCFFCRWVHDAYSGGRKSSSCDDGYSVVCCRAKHSGDVCVLTYYTYINISICEIFADSDCNEGSIMCVCCFIHCWNIGWSCLTYFYAIFWKNPHIAVLMFGKL